MISSFRTVLGAIKVVERGDVITISGLSARGFSDGIARLWKTSRIIKNMFIRASGGMVSFHRFYAPDVLYMVERLIEERPYRTNVRTLGKVRDLLLEETWLADTLKDPTPRLDLKRVEDLTIRPKDYQERFLKEYDRKTQQYHLGGYLLAATPGSGKTVTSMWLGACLDADCVIVVSPKNAVERVWESEIQSKHRKAHSYWVYSQGKSWNDPHYVVLHYEALVNAPDILSRLSKRKRILVILDECHNLNDIRSLRTQRYLQMVESLRDTADVVDVLPMSGTPLKAVGQELVPILSSFDPYFNEKAAEAFRKIYGRDGKRGLDILNHRMGNISYRVMKSQLGLDKPIHKPLKVTIPNGDQYTLKVIAEDMRTFISERVIHYAKRSKEDHAFYRECLDLVKEQLNRSELRDFDQYQTYVKLIQRYKGDSRQVGDEIVWSNQYEKNVIIPRLPQTHKARFKDVKSVVKYLNLKIQGEALGRVLGRKRTECHVEMVREIDFVEICNSTEKKTVVFTSFVPALEETSKILSQSDELNPVTVYGKTSGELSRLIQAFEKQEDLNPLIATYQSLSTAVPLVMADTMIMVDSPFRAYIKEQAVARINRLGADTQATILECSLDTGNEPNISTRSADIMEWSQQQVEAIMGNDYVGSESFQVSIENHSLVVSSETYDVIVATDVSDAITTMAPAGPVFLNW